MIDFISENYKWLAAIYAFVAPFAGYLIAHKVRNATEKKLLAEANSLEVSTISEVIDIYKDEVGHIKNMFTEKVKGLHQEIEILEATNKELQEINKEHKKENDKLRKHNQELKKLNQDHEKTIGKLNAIITHQKRKITTYEKKYGEISS